MRLTPAEDGRVGAWLVLGPFEPSKDDVLERPPENVDESLAPSNGREAVHGVKWQIAWSSRGPIDLTSALHTKRTNRIGYAAATLHLARPTKILLLIGSDDGVFPDGIACRSSSTPRNG